MTLLLWCFVAWVALSVPLGIAIGFQLRAIGAEYEEG